MPSVLGPAAVSAIAASSFACAQSPTLEFTADLVVHAFVTGTSRVEQRVPAGTALLPGQSATRTAGALAQGLHADAMASVGLSSTSAATTVVVRSQGWHDFGLDPTLLVPRDCGVDLDLRLYLPTLQRTRHELSLLYLLKSTGGAGLSCPWLELDLGDDGTVELLLTCSNYMGTATLAAEHMSGTLVVRIRANGLVQSVRTDTADHFRLDFDLVAAPVPLGDFRPYGSGCAGTAGVPELRAAPGSWPVPGSAFQMVLDNLPPLPGIAFGFASTGPPPVGAPFDLGGLGMPGCPQHLRPPPCISWLLAYSGSRVDWLLPIPNQPTVLGVDFLAQGWVLDGPANPLGAIVSNPGAAIVGY